MSGSKKTCSHCKNEYDGLQCPYCIRDGGFRGDEDVFKDPDKKGGDGDKKGDGKKDDGEKK